MDDKVKIKNKIIKRLDEISESKLDKVFNYIETLGGREKNTNEILSFAGTWNDIDSELFSEFTEKLLDRRTKNSGRRIF